MTDSKKALLGEAYPDFDPRYEDVSTADVNARMPPTSEQSIGRTFGMSPEAIDRAQVKGNAQWDQLERLHRDYVAPHGSEALANSDPNWWGKHVASNPAYGPIMDYLNWATPTHAIMAGVKAKGANLPKLEEAYRLKRAGANRDEIMHDTGWSVPGSMVADALPIDSPLRQPQTRPRFEISDSEAGFNDKPTTPRSTMGMHYEHPELYYNYPDAKKVQLREMGIEDVNREPGKWNLGGFQPEEGKYGRLYLPAEYAWPEEMTRAGSTREGTVAHEFDHWVANKEKFPRGANWREPANAEAGIALLQRAPVLVRQLEDQIRAHMIDYLGPNRHTADPVVLELAAQDWAMKNPAAYNAFNQLGDMLRTPDKMERAGKAMMLAYKLGRGEAMARVAGDSTKMTAAERAQMPYWYRYDFPENMLHNIESFEQAAAARMESRKKGKP